MIRFYDVANTAHLAQATLKRTTGVNGSKTLTGEIVAGAEVISGIDQGWSLVFDGESYVITYAKVNDQTTTVEFDAIQKFFWDFAKTGFYEEWNGSHSFEAYLVALFKDTNYEFVLDADIAAFEKQNWGLKNRLTLFNDIINQAEVEFELIGNQVKIIKSVGSDLSSIVRKGFNLSDMVRETSTSGFATYAKGFGAYTDSEDHTKGRLEVEYKSPLAATYGVLEADPVVDERYTIADSLLSAVKLAVDDSISISVDLTIYDLKSADYPYEPPQAGDWVMAIDENIGFKRRIRIIKVEDEYDVNGQRINYTATCGALPVAAQQELAQANQANKVERLESDVGVVLTNANGYNHNTFENRAPVDGTDLATEGDIWYQQNGKKTTMWKFNNGRWEVATNDMTGEEIKQQVSDAFADMPDLQARVAANDARVDANDAKTDAAVAAANQAVADAGFSKNQVTLIKADMADALTQVSAATAQVNTAVNAANVASKDASNALTNAVTAVKSADSALANAATAVNTANSALTNAATALNTANNVKTTTNNLVIKVDDIAGTIETLATSETVDKLTGTVTTVQNLAQLSADGLKLKADTTVVNAIDQTVNKQGAQLALTATKAELGLTQTNVDNLKKTVTDQGLKVDATATGLALKADSTTVSALNQTVVKQSSQLALTATKAELQVTQTATDNLKKTVTSNTAGITTNANAIKLKADTSTVNLIDGTVKSLSGQLDIQAGLVAAKVTANDVTGMLGGYATQSWSQGQISAAKNEISASVETVKQTVNNMQVGGRNLVLNSDFENAITNVDNVNRGNGSWSTDYSYQGNRSVKVVLVPPVTSADSGVIIRFKNAQPNATYTATGWLYSDVSRTLTISGYSAAWWSIGRLSVALAAKTWTKFEYHFTTEISVANAGVAVFVNGTTGNDIQPFYIDLVKIEQANVATDWSPAPEDQATVDWTKSQLDIKDGKISAAVTSLKSDIANATADMATQAWTQGKIETTADNINLSVQNVQSNLDDIEIGNRNYLLDTSTPFEADWNNTTTGDQLFYAWNYSGGGLKDNGFKPGELALLEYDWEISNATTYSEFAVYFESTPLTVVSSTGTKGNATTTVAPSETLTSGHVTVLVKWKDAVETNTQTRIKAYCVSGFAAHIKISNVILAKRNVPGDWTPAPEDIASATDFANLEIKVNGIQGTVANKADQSQVTQLADQVTSVLSTANGNSSQITQLQDDINLRVKTGDYASAMLNINNMIEAKVDNDNFIGAMLSMSDAIDLKVYNAKNGNLLRNSEFITDKYWASTGNHSFWPFEPKKSSINVPSVLITATGAGDKTGGRLTTEFKADGLKKYDKVTLSFYAQGTAGTQLTFTLNGTTLDTYAVTLTATRTYYTLSSVYDTGNKLSIFADRADNAILVDSLMLVKGDTALPWGPAGDNILTRIYMDDSDILIQGKHIHLDGDTTIDYAIIKSAMIDTVSANKLTAGTIDANDINVIHINGQNITANSITGDKLSANAIQVGLNNLGSVIRLNPTSLDFYDAGRRSMSLQDDGMHIIDYLNGEDVGLIHVNRIDGHDNVNGLQFDLNKNGDYMAWGQRSDDTSLYDVKMGWFNSYGASQTSFNQGFNFEDYVTFHNLIKMQADQGLRFTSINYNDNRYASLTSDNRKVGILFGTTELYLMRNDHVVSLADILSKLGYVI